MPALRGREARGPRGRAPARRRQDGSRRGSELCGVAIDVGSRLVPTTTSPPVGAASRRSAPASPEAAQDRGGPGFAGVADDDRRCRRGPRDFCPCRTTRKSAAAPHGGSGVASEDCRFHGRRLASMSRAGRYLRVLSVSPLGAWATSDGIRHAVGRGGAVRGLRSAWTASSAAGRRRIRCVLA
jgi:hypothetical protein